jgi:hypothetical protein
MNVNLEVENECPTCKSKLDTVTAIGRPASHVKKGDLTVCAYCGETLVFTDDKGHLRILTEEEEEKMDDNSRDLLSAIQARVKARNRGRFAM